MTNSKIKRNLAGLLAVLQLGLVAGCSQKRVSDDEYKEALEQIEQLEEDNRDLTEENKRLGDENKALAEENQALKADLNAIGDEQNPVTDEVDNPKVDTSDEEAKPNPVTDSVEALNAALLQEIGLDFDYSNISVIKSCIEFLNNFIATYPKAEYEIQKNDGFNRIEFRNDDAIIASVTYDVVNKVLSINLQYYGSHCYYCAVFDDNNELAYFDGGSGWNVDNMYYVQGYSEYPKADGNSSCYNYIDVSNYEDFTPNLHIEAYKVFDGENWKYFLSLNDEADIGLKSVKLNEEDYQALVNLFNSYDTNSGNILDYVKGTIIEVITKYGKEAEFIVYIDIMNGKGARTLETTN